MTQSYRWKISGMSAGDIPGISLSRNTRLSSVRLNSTGPVGHGEGMYRTSRSPCTSASSGKLTEAKAS